MAKRPKIAEPTEEEKEAAEIVAAALSPKGRTQSPMNIVRTPSNAKRKQRQALHEMLSEDVEYSDMGDHIMIDSYIEKALDQNVRDEASLTNVGNVMRLIYYDVQGYGMRTVSDLMELPPEDVRKIRATEAYKGAKAAVMSEIINTSRRVMEVSAIKAVKTLTECMSSKNDKIKLAASVEILNRVGLNATQKIEVTATNSALSTLSDEDLNEILRGSNYIATTAEIIND